MRTTALLALAALVLAACTSQAQPTPSATPTPAPTVAPTATPGPTATPSPTDGRRTPPPSESPSPTPSLQPTAPPGGFLLTVLPVQEPIEARMAIPGEETCFLVMAGGGQGAVAFEVSAENAAVSGERPDGLLQPGSTVGEACVIVDPAATEQTTVTVTITASRNGFEQSQQRTIGIREMENDREPLAQPYLERWIAWLESAHPEYGISAATEWQPSYVQPVLIVSHLAFWSEDWEMVISWHNMIRPHDFTEIFLRHRFTESGYSAAFRIDSFQDQTDPRPIPPRDLIR